MLNFIFLFNIYTECLIYQALPHTHIGVQVYTAEAFACATLALAAFIISTYGFITISLPLLIQTGCYGENTRLRNTDRIKKL